MIIQTFIIPETWAEAMRQESMVVTGNRSLQTAWDTAVPTDSLDIDAARQRGQQTLADVLMEQPGVEVIPGIRGQTLRLQGFDSKYVLILVNGQRMTGKVGEAFDLTSVPLDQIERVEMIRGAGSALYGSEAIAGVLNILLRRPRRNSQDARLRWGSDQQMALGAQMGFVGDSHDQSLTVDAAQRAAWHRDSTPATAFSGTDEAGISWQHHHDINQQSSLSTRLAYQNQVIHGTDVSAAGAVWDRRNQIERYTLQLSPAWRWDNGSQVKLESQFQVYEDRYRTELRLRPAVHTQEDTAERMQEHTLSYQHHWGSTHAFTWGLTWLDESLRSDRVRQGQVARTRLSPFLQDEWTPEAVTDLTVVPGLRVDDDSQFGSQVSGKLALRYALSPDTIIRPSYGEGFRAPAFKELYLRFENTAVGYVVEGYEGLKPERSRSWQWALDHRISGQQSLGWNVYQNEITDSIQTTRLTVEGSGLQRYGYRNIARARHRGADASYRWTSESLDFLLSLQYLDARDMTSRTRLEGRSLTTVSGQIQRWQITDRLQLHVGARGMSPQLQPDELGQLTRTASAFWATAGALHRWNAAWTSGLTIENLGNNREDRILEVRPRSYIVSLHWNHQNERKD